MQRTHPEIWILLGLLSAIGGRGLAFADEEERSSAADLGRASYERHCAACHGLDGRGSGDFANLLKVAPKDLTAIAARRGGSFPSTEIAEIIDGRQTPRAHGSAEMPMWGERLGESSPPSEGRDASVRGEIYLIVEYLRSLQPGVEATPESPGVEAKKVAQVGEQQFMRDCASCHGVTGAGDGNVGKLLSTPPANLRTIAARNGGKFPTLKIANMIDGRERVIAHGSRDMPIWGKRFRGLGGTSRGSAVRGEVMLYVAYLRSIQEP